MVNFITVIFTTLFCKWNRHLQKNWNWVIYWNIWLSLNFFVNELKNSENLKFSWLKKKKLHVPVFQFISNQFSMMHIHHCVMILLSLNLIMDSSNGWLSENLTHKTERFLQIISYMFSETRKFHFTNCALIAIIISNPFPNCNAMFTTLMVLCAIHLPLDKVFDIFLISLHYKNVELWSHNG